MSKIGVGIDLGEQSVHMWLGDQKIMFADAIPGMGDVISMFELPIGFHFAGSASNLYRSNFAVVHGDYLYYTTERYLIKVHLTNETYEYLTLDYDVPAGAPFEVAFGTYKKGIETGHIIGNTLWLINRAGGQLEWIVDHWTYYGYEYIEVDLTTFTIVGVYQSPAMLAFYTGFVDSALINGKIYSPCVAPNGLAMGFVIFDTVTKTELPIANWLTRTGAGVASTPAGTFEYNGDLYFAASAWGLIKYNIAADAYQAITPQWNFVYPEYHVIGGDNAYLIINTLPSIALEFNLNDYSARRQENISVASNFVGLAGGLSYYYKGLRFLLYSSGRIAAYDARNNNSVSAGLFSSSPGGGRYFYSDYMRSRDPTYWSPEFSSCVSGDMLYLIRIFRNAADATFMLTGITEIYRINMRTVAATVGRSY